MRDLLLAAAGQERHHRPCGIEASLAEERVAVGRPLEEAHQGVADEGDGHARLPVQLLLEGEDHDHARHRPADGVHAASPPRPELRRDVIDDGDTAVAERAGQPEVEVRVVDEHGGVRRPAVHLLHDAPEHGAQVAQVGEDLEQADDGQVLRVGEQRRALGLEAVASKAEHVQVSHALAELAHELRAVEVPRSLAARDQEAGHGAGSISPVISRAQCNGARVPRQGHRRRAARRREGLDRGWFMGAH